MHYVFLSILMISLEKYTFSLCQCCCQKVKGAQGVIQIENPNLAKPKNLKARDVDVSYSTKIFVCRIVARH